MGGCFLQAKSMLAFTFIGQLWQEMNHPIIVFQVQRAGLIYKKDVERRKEIFLKRSTA